MKQTELDFELLKKNLDVKFPFGIPRNKLGEATGGVLHPRTEANRDCLKCGIPGKFNIGRGAVYPVAGVLQYLQNRISESHAT